MGRFRSGIILETRCVIAQGEDDSHSKLLEYLNIRNSLKNARTKFVGVELVPPNGEWWTDPENWTFNVVQETTPEWFEKDRKKYIDRFRSEVKKWWSTHCLSDQGIGGLCTGYYRLRNCAVSRLSKNVMVHLDNSTVEEMTGDSKVVDMIGNSTIMWMEDNSTVEKMAGNSIVRWMERNSTVGEMTDRSKVEKMLDASTVKKMKKNSSVLWMEDDSTVQRMDDNSMVWMMMDRSAVEKMEGNAIVRWLGSISTIGEMYGNSIVVSDTDQNIHIAATGSAKLIRHTNVEADDGKN